MMILEVWKGDTSFIRYVPLDFPLDHIDLYIMAAGYDCAEIIGVEY